MVEKSAQRRSWAYRGELEAQLGLARGALFELGGEQIALGAQRGALFVARGGRVKQLAE